MTDEMTPREHDDMRDLVLAGTQRIRPSRSYRRLAAVGVAVVVIAGVAGGVAAIVAGRDARDDSAPVGPTITSPPVPPAPSPTPTPTMPPEWCEPKDFPQASLPQLPLPAPGETLVLPSDPCLTAKTLLGSYSWLEDQGIDADLIQGFQGVGGIESWTAPLADGSGACILIRAANHNGWGTIECDSAGTPAVVNETVQDTPLRFVIEDGAIVVRAPSP